MPKKTREDFKPYLRRLADKMGLKDWVVDVHEDPPADRSHVASADCCYGQRRVTVFLASAFFRDDEAEQRDTIVHELIHAHLAGMHNYLSRALNADQWKAYDLAMEYGVDGLAKVIAPSMPLPSEVEPGSDTDARDEGEAASV